MRDRRASTAAPLYCCGSGVRLGSLDSPSALAVSISPFSAQSLSAATPSDNCRPFSQSSWIFRPIRSPYRSFPSASRP